MEPKSSTDGNTDENKIIELECKVKKLTQDIEQLLMNAAGLVLNCVHIDKCSEFLFSVRMGRTLVWVHGSMQAIIRSEVVTSFVVFGYCLANTVQFKSWNIALGVEVVQALQEEARVANEKYESLQATVDKLEGKIQIGLDKDWLNARNAKDLDDRMTHVEASVNWLCMVEAWWTTYVLPFTHWHRSSPSTPR